MLTTLTVSLPAWSVGQAARPAGSVAATPAPLVIQHVTVIDVQTGRLHPDQAVVIVGHRIQAVGPTRKVRVPVQARLVEGRDQYLIPGLWDLHLHVGRAPTRFFFPLLIANGITGFRDPTGRVPPDTARRWRQEVHAGTRVGPRQVIGWRKFNQLGKPLASAKIAIAVQTAAEARAVVDSLQRWGAEFIKVQWNWMPRALFFAILAEGRRRGIPIVGHPQTTVTLLEASDSGYRTIEHLGYLVDSAGGYTFQDTAVVNYPPWLVGTCAGAGATLARCQAVAQHLRRNGTWITPTLVARARGFDLPRLSSLPRGSGNRGKDTAATTAAAAQFDRIYRPIVTRLQEAGMPLLAGTDNLSVLVHEELALLVREGLTPLGALQAATLNPAKYLGATDSLGTVAVGKLADLVLLDRNPLVDIRNTAAIRAVVADGHYYDRAALDQMLAAVRDTVATKP